MVQYSRLAWNGGLGARSAAALAGSASLLALMLAAPATAQAPAGTPATQAPPTTTDNSAAAAAADDSNGAAPDIVVTGSRITAAGFDAPTPTQVLGQDLIQKQAQPNIFNAVTQLPSLQGSTGTQVANGNTSTGATGLSGLNLRGLGTFRTLTLLDGQRVVPANINNITDISQFPQLLVQRVEVVTGGASASYGSDAVAGVVNFITDKKFEGFKANLQAGVTTYGDDPQGTLSFAFGTKFLDDRLHLVVSAEYFYNHGIIPGGNFYSLPNHGRPNLPQTGSGSYSIAGTPAGSPQIFYYLDGAQDITKAGNGLITAGPLEGIAFGPGGVPFFLRYGGSGVPTRTAAGGVIGCVGTSTCQGGDFEGPLSTAGGDDSIDNRLDRKVAYARVSYDLTDRISFFGTVNLANVNTINRPTQGIPQAGLTVQCDNAFLNQTVKNYCANPSLIPGVTQTTPITSFTLGTIGQNLPGYITVYNHRKQRRFVVGAEGSFDLLGKAWTFESYFEYGKSYTNINVKNNVLRALYNAATDAIRLPTGEIVCRNVTARASGCVPYNAFGSGVDNSFTAFRYFSPESGSKSFNRERQNAASIAINGTPFKTWAGDLSVAFGAEWREEGYKVRGDPYGAGVAASPYNIEFPANPLVPTAGSGWFAGNFANGQGHYNVKDFFFETGVPLLNSDTLGKLDFNGAIRFTDYSTSGSVKTWKLGGTWDTPLEGLRLRAVRSRDIRAPNLSDLFSPPVSVNSQFTDRTNNLQVAAQQRTRGNPNLRPEIAKNLEAGVVYSPQFVRGLRLSFDYFNIKLKDAIQVLQGQQVIDLCFNGNNTFCGTDNYFLGGVQGSNNQSYVNVQPFNVASVKTRGFDIEASYRFELQDKGVPGNFTLRGLATRTIDLTSNPGVPGQAIVQLAGNNNTNNIAPGTVGIARWKAFLQQSWEVGKFNFTSIERIISSGKINPDAIVCQVGSCPVTTIQNPTVNYNYIPGRFYVDLSVSFDMTKNMSLFAKVDNVTNKFYPRFGSDSLYDNIGRRFQAGVRLNY